jgi:hypothetical protein
MMDLSGVGLGLRRMTSRDKLMELFQHTVRVISRVVHQNLASFQEQLQNHHDGFVRRRTWFKA